MASTAVFREDRHSTPEELVLSALKLVTCLPSSEHKAPAFSSRRHLRTDYSCVPAPLQFSPLAYSLERRASLICSRKQSAIVAKQKDVVPRLAREVQDSVLALKEAAASASEELARTVQEQILGTLQALNQFGLAVRSLFPVPDQCRVEDWRRSASRRSDLAFAAVLPGDGVAEIVIAQSIFNFLNIYNTLLVVRLVLTWFPSPPQFIAQPLSTICDPYLNLFRGIIPPLGGTLDFSPILAFVVLNVFTNAAAAIPAEMPGEFGPASAQSAVEMRKRLMGGTKHVPRGPHPPGSK